MKLNSKVILTVVVSTAALAAPAAAQGFFDDKKFSKPVPHMSRYNNDEWTLKKVHRTDNQTILIFNYHTAYRSQGSWTCLDIDDCLTNPVTGEKYPIISSTGIPKSPARYIWSEGPDQNREVTVSFPAIPEGVKTLDSTFGIYDIDISSMPVSAAPGSISVFPKNCRNKSGTLQVYNVTRSGEYVTVTFYYTSSSYGGWCRLMGTPTIRDNAAHTTYAMSDCAGITRYPEKTNVEKDKILAFMLNFKVPAADRLDSFDFIDGGDGSWNISNIPLK